MKMMTYLSGIVAALATFSSPAFAAPEIFIIDNAHTFPRFSYSHLGYSKQTSRFNKTTGKIVLDQETKTASVDITIDMTSVDTGSSLFDQHIQNEDFFNTEKYPTAIFKSTNVRFDGEKPVAVDGHLTIKGVTEPVTLNIEAFQRMPHPMLKKEALGANASTTIRRSEFNAGKHVPYVSDEVTIDIAVEAIKE